MSDQITATMYNGEVEIKFSAASHRYTIKHKGKRVWWPSVTAATGSLDKSRALIPWAVGLAGSHIRQFIESMSGPYTAEQLLPVIDEALKQHQIRKEAAATAGTIVHDYAEAYALASMNGQPLPGIPEDIPDASVLGISAFIDWVDKHRVKFIASERIVASKEHRFVGILDSIAEVDGVLALIDYKTAKGVYDEHWMQTSGYLLAYNEEMAAEKQETIDRRVILHFDKETGQFHDHVSEGKELFDLDVQGFLGALSLKKWQSAREKLRA